MINSTSPNVVYWIGAGASYNALPIVDEMALAMQAQSFYLKNTKASIIKDLDTHKVKLYTEYLEQMGIWSKAYGTIDTYARSLYLLNKPAELGTLKLHLGMFFMLSQALPLLSPRPSLHRSKIEGCNPPDAPSYFKRDRIDTRYMGLLAVLMDRQKFLSPNVRIVSWNYDLQIDHAVALYKGFDQLGEIKNHPSITLHPRPNGEQWSEDVIPAVIRLNGIAGQASVNTRHYHVSAEMKTSNENDSFVKYLFNLYPSDFDTSSSIGDYDDRLTFAWENKPVATEAVELAKKAFSIARILVIIGYSFPSFNRSIDKQLYKSFCDKDKQQKQVIIQNSRISKETFMKIIGQTASSPKINIEENLDQFYIPSELF